VLAGVPCSDGDLALRPVEALKNPGASYRHPFMEAGDPAVLAMLFEISSLRSHYFVPLLASCHMQSLTGAPS